MKNPFSVDRVRSLAAYSILVVSAAFAVINAMLLGHELVTGLPADQFVIISMIISTGLISAAVWNASFRHVVCLFGPLMAVLTALILVVYSTTILLSVLLFLGAVSIFAGQVIALLEPPSEPAN